MAFTLNLAIFIEASTVDQADQMCKCLAKLSFARCWLGKSPASFMMITPKFDGLVSDLLADKKDFLSKSCLMVEGAPIERHVSVSWLINLGMWTDLMDTG